MSYKLVAIKFYGLIITREFNGRSDAFLVKLSESSASMLELLYVFNAAKAVFSLLFLDLENVRLQVRLRPLRSCQRKREINVRQRMEALNLQLKYQISFGKMISVLT